MKTIASEKKLKTQNEPQSRPFLRLAKALCDVIHEFRAAAERDRRDPSSSLFLPDPPGDTQLELLPVAAREEQGHVPLDDEPIVAVPDLPVAVPDAPGHPLPDHLAPRAPYLQAVAVVLRFRVVSHEPQEGDVDG